MKHSTANVCGIIHCTYSKTNFVKPGGETIRQINQASGAHVELNRTVPENGPTRLFIIRGL